MRDPAKIAAQVAAQWESRRSRLATLRHSARANERDLKERAKELAEDLRQVSTRRDLQALNLPGFFPTPPALAARLVAMAGVRPGMTVLEPSAGEGAIAREIRRAEVEPDCVEWQYTLRQALERQGFRLVGDDCLTYAPSAIYYDAVVMNPPFEGGQDVDHVRHCYGLLKTSGGVLVSVMSEGAFFRRDSKATLFRQWLEDLGGHSEKLPEGTFQTSGTGTNTRVIRIRT